MNYAKDYYIGNNKHYRKRKTETTAPTVKRIRPLDAETKGRRGSAQRQMHISPDFNASDGFLKCSFLPKLKETKTIRDCRKSDKTEKDFFQSLSKLAKHYQIEPLQTSDVVYPYNVALALSDIEEKLKQTNADWQEIRLMQDSRKTYLVSEEKYSTGTTLYYIPVEPLYQMLHDKKRKSNAHLLLSVCSYLYHIADIPYFRQEDSYLYWMYEMHKDWVLMDDETDMSESYEREFLKAELIGDLIEQRIFNQKNLQMFEHRLNTFKSRDAYDHECWQTAYDALALYTVYPQQSIFRNAPLNDNDNDGEGENNVGMHKYISFIGNTKGWLYENLEESINNEFNEYAEMQEPTICKSFDETDSPVQSLDFENKLFKLLDDMCGLLYNYKTTRNEKS